MAGKDLSLIITTYNRGSKLWTTLNSLICQTLRHDIWELVVVDNNSTDDTASRFALWAGEHPEIDARMVHETIQGVSAARNRGIEESCGRYIVVIDDDEIVAPGFLEEYYRLFSEHADVAAAGGRILPDFEDGTPRWMSKYTERAIVGTLDLGGAVCDFPDGAFFGGGNHGYRRSVVERYGGYDTSLGRTGGVLLAGEEKEFYKRIHAGGERIVYLPDAVIYHLVGRDRLTRDYFTRLCRNLGRSERRRTLSMSKGRYLQRLAAEVIKWGGASVLAVGYCCGGHPSRGGYLLLMRWHITAGLLGA